MANLSDIQQRIQALQDDDWEARHDAMRRQLEETQAVLDRNSVVKTTPLPNWITWCSLTFNLALVVTLCFLQLT